VEMAGEDAYRGAYGEGVTILRRFLCLLILCLAPTLFPWSFSYVPTLVLPSDTLLIFPSRKSLRFSNSCKLHSC